MSFNALWSVGREPKVSGVRVKYVIDSTGNTSWNAGAGTNNLTTFTIPDGNVQIYSMQITLRPINSNGTTGEAVSPTIEINIDGFNIAKFTLPPTCGDAQEWNIQEQIPYSYYVTTPNSHIFSVQKATTSVGGNGYQARYNIALFGVLV